jgi:Flp pilus assembly pilin Flp
MTEYIILVMLISIACIGVVTVFGDDIRRMFGNSADALEGATTMDYAMSPAGSKAAATKGLAKAGDDNGTVY